MYSQNLTLLEREGHALGRKKMEGGKKTLVIGTKKEHICVRDCYDVEY